MGDDSIDEVSGEVHGELMKLREICEKSESSPDRNDELDEDDEIDLISGAVRARTFVVEINSVGREIWPRWMVPVGNLTLPSRVGSGAGTSERLARLVRALARAIVEEDIVNCKVLVLQNLICPLSPSETC